MQARWFNQQKEVRVPLRQLQRQLKRALTFPPRSFPATLKKIEIVLLDADQMRRVHADFLQDATVTDVITFPYGEILLCPAVAREEALKRGHAPEQEILLYALHGLLHLAGYDDTTPQAAQEMAAVQEKWLKKTLGRGDRLNRSS